MPRIERLFLVMVTLVVLPRLALDLYLPSLPEIGRALNTSDSAAQITLTMFMFGYACSMLIAGQLSDIIGNKRVLIYGLSLFLISTMVCALTNSIVTLIIARFFQALGGCCGTVIARVLVKDFYHKEQQIKMLAYLSAIMSICPLFIPICGGALQIYFGWRTSFYVLVLFATGMLVLIKHLDITEKAPEPTSLKNLLPRYQMLITNPLFLGYSFLVAFSWSCYFAFSFESPFILQKILGFNSVIFGLLYSIPILGYLLGTQVTMHFANKMGWNKLIFMAALILVGGSGIMITALLFFTLHWTVIILPMFVVMTGLGIIIPCCQAAVMQPFPSIAGTASGLFFFIQMAIGSLWGLILSYFTNNTPLVMAISILISSVLGFLVFYCFVIDNLFLKRVSQKFEQVNNK